MFTLVLGLSALNAFLDLFFLFALVGLTESEAFYGLPVFAMLAAGIFYFAFGVNVPAALLSVPFTTYLFSVAGYAAAGAVWSAFKWWLYARSVRTQVADMWQRYKNGNEKATVADFEKSPVYNPLYRNGVSLSNANNLKIVNWAVMWPVSVFWTLVRGFTVDLGKVVLTLFGRVYDSLAGTAYRELK